MLSLVKKNLKNKNSKMAIFYMDNQEQGAKLSRRDSFYDFDGVMI